MAFLGDILFGCGFFLIGYAIGHYRALHWAIREVEKIFDAKEC